MEHVQTHAAQIMGLDVADGIAPGRPLTDLGLDSLMAVALRNAIAGLVGPNAQADQDADRNNCFDHTPISSLS